MNIDLQELLNKNIISTKVSEDINAFYKENKVNNNNIANTINIISIILISLGIVSIVAYNWSNISFTIKLSISFIPLVLSQILCFFCLVRKTSNFLYKEGSAVFLFIAIAINLAVISQIYHLDSNLKNFILIWMISVLPIIYIMKSNTSSLLYILGITFYSTNTSYYYWLLLLALLPYIYLITVKKQNKNIVQHIFLAISTVISTLYNNNYSFVFYVIQIFALLTIFIFINRLNIFENKINRFYLVSSEILMTIFLVMLSNYEVWKYIDIHPDFLTIGFWLLTENIITMVISILAIVMIAIYIRKNTIYKIKIADITFIPYILVLIINTYWYFFYNTGEDWVYSIPRILIIITLINLFVVYISITRIIDGINQKKLIKTNFGLITICILIAMHFFSSSIDFISKGIGFISLGIVLLLVNFLMIKKFKKNKNEV